MLGCCTADSSYAGGGLPGCAPLHLAILAPEASEADEILVVQKIQQVGRKGEDD